MDLFESIDIEDLNPKPEDAEFDRIQKEWVMIQCRKCKYFCTTGTVKHCDFISQEGRLTHRGKTPGTCRDFAPGKPINRKRPLSNI